MNTRLIIGILSGAGVGFASGWFLHQDAAPKKDSSSIRVAQLETELKSKAREIERLSKAGAKHAVAVNANAPADTPDMSKNPEVIKMQERMKKQMQDKQ